LEKRNGMREIHTADYGSELHAESHNISTKAKALNPGWHSVLIQLNADQAGDTACISRSLTEAHF